MSSSESWEVAGGIDRMVAGGGGRRGQEDWKLGGREAIDKKHKKNAHSKTFCLTFKKGGGCRKGRMWE